MAALSKRVHSALAIRNRRNIFECNDMSDEYGLLDKVFLPKDDFQHPVGEDANWNESYYWAWADTTSEIAGFSRIGIKANNGYSRTFPMRESRRIMWPMR